MTILGLAFGALFVGLLLWVWGERLRRRTGLPAGRVVSVDLSRLKPQTVALYDPEWDLAGRPDFLLEDRGRIFPVELKSALGAGAPYPSHRIQLAAYCRLVESTYGQRPPYGILRYADRTFAVDYDPSLQAELRELIGALRAQRGRRPSRSHSIPERCRACGFRPSCDQSLV